MVLPRRSHSQKQAQSQESDDDVGNSEPHNAGPKYLIGGCRHNKGHGGGDKGDHAYFRISRVRCVEGPRELRPSPPDQPEDKHRLQNLRNTQMFHRQMRDPGDGKYEYQVKEKFDKVGALFVIGDKRFLSRSGFNHDFESNRLGYLPINSLNRSIPSAGQ